MAEPMSLIHFGSATKSPLSKPKESDNRAQSSRDHQPPPPKKVRSEEKSLKPKKLNGEGGGGGGGGEEKQQQQKKQQQSYGSPTTWSVSPAQPALHKVHSVFKQSAFLASPPKAKKLKEKREHDKERDKDKRKHKPDTSGGSLGSAALKAENGELKASQKGNTAPRALRAAWGQLLSARALTPTRSARTRC